jgi:hypothetical protein
VTTLHDLAALSLSQGKLPAVPNRDRSPRIPHLAPSTTYLPVPDGVRADQVPSIITNHGSDQTRRTSDQMHFAEENHQEKRPLLHYSPKGYRAQGNILSAAPTISFTATYSIVERAYPIMASGAAITACCSSAACTESAYQIYPHPRVSVDPTLTNTNNALGSGQRCHVSFRRKGTYSC